MGWRLGTQSIAIIREPIFKSQFIVLFISVRNKKRWNRKNCVVFRHIDETSSAGDTVCDQIDKDSDDDNVDDDDDNDESETQDRSARNRLRIHREEENSVKD